MPMMKVPAAFKSAPSIPRRHTMAGNMCACGSAMYKTYVIMRRGGRNRHVSTPVMWCQHCMNLGSSLALSGQTEVRDSQFKWSCEHCGGIMHRLLTTRGGSTGLPIPLSYCLECASVSFRAIAGSCDTRACEMCGTSVSSSSRWCAGCGVIAERWRKRHGVIPRPGDWNFEEVIRRVKLEAHRLGWSRRPGMRLCVSCRAEYPVAGRRRRRCGDCADVHESRQQEKRQVSQKLARRLKRRMERGGMAGDHGHGAKASGEEAAVA